MASMGTFSSAAFAFSYAPSAICPAASSMIFIPKSGVRGYTQKGKLRTAAKKS
jgi:hypothetical protein